MKKILFPIFISLLIIFSGCSKESINQSINNQQKSGKVSFSIDKVNAPKEVVKITAYLTRQGYQTLQSSMNLLSDSTADLIMSDVAIGIWHLKVDAENSDSEIIYTGESNVEVLEGTTVQVSLTLLPTDVGTGNINIFVTWRVRASSWTDFSGNPIFTINDSPTYPLHLSQGKVLFEDGSYKMWFYNTYASAKGNIGYAESNDGLSWENIISPVISPGSSGSWDDYTASIGPVIKVNNTYKMYYGGYRNENSKWHIGLATSVDGKVWEKFPEPVLYANDDEFQISASDVIIKDNLYYMFYNVRHGAYRSINLATSEDGIHWTKYSGNPVMSSTSTWEGSGIYYASVIYENNIFKMIYMNYNANGFGKAVSTDGINWTKDSGNPVFTPGKIANNWGTMIAYPDIIKVGTYYRLYYSAQIDYYSALNIGVAYSSNF